MKKTSTIKHDRLNSQPLNSSSDGAKKDKASTKKRATKGANRSKDQGLRHAVSYESVGDSESKQSVQGKLASSK